MASILVVEDEPNIAESLGFILERAGHAVMTVANGETALLQLRKALPDVMVLDLMLPGMGGLDVLKAVKQDARSASLPVIVLTARTQPRARELAEALGAAAYFTKPFSNREVVEAVARHAGGR